MARAATTSDAFNALAERRRREIVELLADREISVNEIAQRLELVPSQVSKHLRVLREVGLVHARVEGRQHWYRLDIDRLQPICDWANLFARYYDRQPAAVKKGAEGNRSGF